MRYKIIAASLLITVAVLSGIYFSVDAIIKNNAYQSIKKTLLNEMSLAGSLVEEYLLQRPLSYGVDSIADTISKDLGVRVTVAGRYGTVVGDSGLDGEKLKAAENILKEPDVRDAVRFSFGEATIESRGRGERTLSLASTFGKSSPEGIIRFSLPISSMYYVSESARIMLGLTILAAMAVFVAAILIVSRVTPQETQDADLSKEGPVSLLPERERLVQESPMLVLSGVRNLTGKKAKRRRVVRRRAKRIKRKKKFSKKTA